MSNGQFTLAVSNVYHNLYWQSTAVGEGPEFCINPAALKVLRNQLAWLFKGSGSTLIDPTVAKATQTNS